MKCCMQDHSETTGLFFKGLDSRKSTRKMLKDKITIKMVMVFDDAARGRGWSWCRGWRYLGELRKAKSKSKLTINNVIEEGRTTFIFCSFGYQISPNMIISDMFLIGKLLMVV